jgi:hypothetical protein
MISTQSLAHKAIHAAKCLSAADDFEFDSMTAEYAAVGSGIRPVEIGRATASTTTSSSVGLLREMHADWPQLGHTVYLVSAKDFTTSPTFTESKNNEALSLVRLAVFDELQRLRADDTRFRAVIRELRTQTAIRERESIANRLEVLLEDFQDDYGRSLNVESLRTFVALLSLHPELRRPAITAAENGNLFAEWKTQDGKRFLGLQMLPMNQVRFVAFRPDAKHSHLRNHSSGVTSVDQLFADLASYDILAWALAV